MRIGIDWAKPGSDRSAYTITHMCRCGAWLIMTVEARGDQRYSCDACGSVYEVSDVSGAIWVFEVRPDEAT